MTQFPPVLSSAIFIIDVGSSGGQDLSWEILPGQVLAYEKPENAIDAPGRASPSSTMFLTRARVEIGCASIDRGKIACGFMICSQSQAISYTLTDIHCPHIAPATPFYLRDANIGASND